MAEAGQPSQLSAKQEASPYISDKYHFILI
jgi:hypothetical protein